MRVLACLAVGALVLTTTPAAAAPPADQRAEVVAALNAWCDERDPRTPEARPLALLLALADGRSAYEFASTLGEIRCLYHVHAQGAGSDEMVSVAMWTVGAILWVDRGWWRIAQVGLGLEPEILARHGDDVLIGLCGCGSGGDLGVVGVALHGPVARTLFTLRPGASQMGARFLDDDHVLVVGRKLPDRPYAWPANCCLPGGHEWLLERRGATFAMVAERQARDPYFVLSTYLGALRVGQTNSISDVATGDALAAADRLVGAGPLSTGTPQSVSLYASGQDELLAWDAIPGRLRAVPHDTPLYASFVLYGSNEFVRRGFTTAVATLERDRGGWHVTGFELDPINTRGVR